MSLEGHTDLHMLANSTPFSKCQDLLKTYLAHLSSDLKILLITYKALNGLAPQYLSELLSHYSPPRPLLSQNSGHLIIPRISKSTAGSRSFFYLAPKLWNNLLNNVLEADTHTWYTPGIHIAH